jgi:Na+-driven multidrug efflux pump
MAEADDARPRLGNVLDPTDRFSEVVFGVVMAMTCTGTVSVASAGEQDMRPLLYAAVGCNLAWGIVDAVGGFGAWRSGIVMLAIGAALVSLVVALGG